MIVKKLDIIQVDVAEDDEGNISYQGATFFYSREVWEDGVNVGKLPNEAVSATVEQAQEILGEAAGAHVQKLNEVEKILEGERAEWAEEKVALEARIEELQGENRKLFEGGNKLADKIAAIVKILTE